MINGLGGDGIRSLVGHPIESGLGSAAADGEVERSVDGVDDEVRQRQWGTADKFFEFT